MIAELNGHARPADYAEAYHAAGLSPIAIRADTSKAPTGAWADYQRRQPTADELARMFLASNVGVAIVYGPASGNAELIDIDDADWFEPYADEVEQRAPGLIAKLTQIKTPRPGYHLVYRCDVVEGNQKLARRYATAEELEKKPEEETKTAIETRGRGGYALAPGSPSACHTTGRTYEHLAGPPLTELPTITPVERAVLLDAGRVFNKVLAEEPDEPQHVQRSGLSPGDDYNARAEWGEILTPHGWTLAFNRGDVTHWTRPGKTEGTSATTGLTSKQGYELLCVFSSNAHPFEGPDPPRQCTPYSKFGAYTLLNHDGDFSAAAKQLASEGYGDGKTASNKPGNRLEDFGPIPPPSPEPNPFKQKPVAKFTVGELAAEYPTLNEIVVDGLIRQGETANVISTSKIGKSWLLYSLLLSVVAGVYWLGRFATTKGKVLLIDNELHRNTLASRIPHVAESLGIEKADYADWFDVWPLRGNLRSLAQLRDELEQIDAGEYRLIALDAKYRFVADGASENDNASETAFYNTLDQIAAQTEAAIVCVHHGSKGNQSDKRVTDVGAGAGAQSRAADCHLVLREHEEDAAVVLEAAVRSFAPVEPLGLRWEFPLWLPDGLLDTEKLKGKQTPQDERQAKRDAEGIDTIVEVLGRGEATRRELRKLTGMGFDRCNRLLRKLVDERRIVSSITIIEGNQTDVFHLPD